MKEPTPMLAAMAERTKRTPEAARAEEQARFCLELADIIQSACPGESMTTGEVARRFGVDRATAKDALGKLEAAGRVSVIGKGDGAQGLWLVAGEQKVDPAAETERSLGEEQT